MKKLLFLPLVVLLFTANAQKALVFKMKYLPGKTYAGGVSLAVNAHINLSGDTAVLAKLKSQGITPPIAFNVSMKMVASTQTGAAIAGGRFPFKMGYHIDDMSMDVNGNAIPVPKDKFSALITMYGHVDAAGKLSADSISGGGAKDTSQAHVAQLINGIQKSIDFPAHPMKIGDTFTQDVPMTIPLGGNSIAATAKAVYKLVSIDGDNANFDVMQTMDMSVPVSGAAMHLAGAGTGKLVYSIKNNFATDYNTSLNMAVDGKIKTLQINATAVMSMEYKYDIN